jgi:4-amino-4-deoxy-L-arabinose transferase-like glycosyltransferase
MNRFRTLSPWLRRVLVFVTAALCAAAFRAAVPSQLLATKLKENTDYHGSYRPVARQILQGRGPVLNDGTPLLRYPPGYSFLLAGAFAATDAIGVSEERAVSLLNIAAFALAAVLLFEIASRLFPWPKTLLTPLVFSSYPLALWATTLALSETVFLPVLYACFLAFGATLRVKGSALREGLACGLSAGVAMMIRAAAIGLSLLLAGMALFGIGRKKPTERIALAAVILAGSVCAAAPWQLWLREKTGHFRMVSGGVASIRDGLTFTGPLKGTTKRQYRATIRVSDGLTEIIDVVQQRYSRLRSLSDIAGLLREQWKERPLAVVELVARKAGRSWYGTDSGRYGWPIVVIQLLYSIPLALGLWATWRSGGDYPRGLVLAALAVVLYSWGMTVVVLSIVRYMVPAIGLLFVFLPALGSPRRTGDSGEGFEHALQTSAR